MLLQTRKAVITGAAGTLGSAIAARFFDEGCAVVLMDIDEQALRKVADRLKRRGQNTGDTMIDLVAVDVTKESEVTQAFRNIDRLDILVNNAGVTRISSVEQLTVAEWDEMLRLNLTSVFLCSKYALPLLKNSQSPAIVNMSSINALRMNPGLPAYSAAKSGLIALTQQLALEGAAAGIRANCILPGSVVSAAEQQARAHEVSFQIERDCYPLGRLGVPEDVANAALFLASNLSAFINGVNLVVDGGMSLQAVSAVVRQDLRSRWKQGEYVLEMGEQT